MAKPSLLGQVTLAVTAVAAIVVAASQVKPVFVGSTPVVQRLVTATWRDSAAARAPWALADADAALRSPRAVRGRSAARSPRTSCAPAASTRTRADSIATYAVREAYRKHLPPALIFGVLLTENSTFKSKAKSNVGAVGLMQIYPKVWVPDARQAVRAQPAHDEMNLRYGVHILSHYVYRAAKKADDVAAGTRTACCARDCCATTAACAARTRRTATRTRTR